MADKKYDVTEEDLSGAEYADKIGCPYQAQYLRMFGHKELDPGRWRGIREEYEDFYKMCVEKGSTAKELARYPDGAMF